MSSVIGGLFGKKASTVSNPTAFQTLPQEIQNRFLDINRRAADVSEGFGVRPETLQGFDALIQEVPNPVRSNFNFGQRANTAFGQAEDAFGRAQDILGGVDPLVQRGAASITSDDIQSGIGDFLNPFTNEVIQRSVRDVNEFGQGLFNDARSLISDAGVTGSNRERLIAQGIADDLARNVGDLSSNLRRSGFESAATRALQRLEGDRSRALQGASAINTAAGTQAGIGSGLNRVGDSFLSGRRLMADISRQQQQDAIAEQVRRARAQLGLGDVLRSEDLQKLQVLQDSASAVPVGGGSIQQRQNQGFLERVSGIIPGFRRPA